MVPRLAVLLLWLLAGCAKPWRRPPAQTYDQFLTEHAAWRAQRRDKLVTSGTGPILWIGLWQLEPGATTVGSDPGVPIGLPASQAPALAGTLTRQGQDVRFQPAAGGRVQLASDSSVIAQPIVLASDISGKPTDLALGSLRLRLHSEPGTDRLWLRGWDENHPAKQAFTLPEEFPPDTAWRLAATFHRFWRPHSSPVLDVTGGPQAYRAPGELEFRQGERVFRLIAFADTSSEDFLVMFADSTSGATTYGSGRYIHVPFPDRDGWTVLDFNRAYSPPCAFTKYSTCALPPEQNRLALTIPVGEKRAH